MSGAKLNHYFQLILLLLGAILAAGQECAQAQTSASTRSTTTGRELTTTSNLLDSVINFPFKDERDREAIHSLILLRQANAGDAEREFLLEAAAFTTGELAPGERLSIVSFSESEDKAIRRLREEVKLAPPPGGAIVRLYQAKASMPPPILALFGENVAGITRWCRYIAVFAEGKSGAELADTISHELAHAYISSALGRESNALPRWFHEGVAQYLSDAQDVYVSQLGFGAERIVWSPKDYEEFRLVFRYLEATIGREGVARFIRESVEGKSAIEPLVRASGNSGYESLLRAALRWRSARQMRIAQTILGGIAAAMVIALLWLRRRRRLRISRTIEELIETEEVQEQYREEVERDYERLNEAETIEEMIAAGRKTREDLEMMALELVNEGRLLAQAGERSQAYEKFDEARHTAPWSSRVRQLIEQYRNEMDGIYL